MEVECSLLGIRVSYTGVLIVKNLVGKQSVIFLT